MATGATGATPGPSAEPNTSAHRRPRPFWPPWSSCNNATPREPPPPPSFICPWSCQNLSRNKGSNTSPFLSKMKLLLNNGGVGGSCKATEVKRSTKDLRKQLAAKDETCKTRSGICVLTFLLLIFFLSTTGFIIMWFTDFYIAGILDQLTIRNGSHMYEAWRRPSLKPLICVHAFNYTNVEHYVSGEHDKIHIQEVGPYCYRETLEKVNITFDEAQDTVTYGDKRRQVFEPGHSGGDKDDLLIVPNLALISAIALTRDSHYVTQLSLSMLLHHIDYNEAFLTVRAHDFFFGYNDKLIGMATRVARFLQHDIPFDKFGILAMRAIQTKETITVRTGVGDQDHIGVVTGVNGAKRQTIWQDPECNRIDGSDGAFFPRKDINRTTTLYIFHKDLCRKMPLIYLKDINFQEDVTALRFHMPENIYDTEGTCFCPHGNCAPRGVFDLAPCQHGLPLMTSFPHFLNGDPELRAPFEGLHPDPEKHDFFVDIQPTLGFTLGTISRVQLNIRVQKAYGIDMLDEFDDNAILPIVWLEMTADRMPEDMYKMIYHATVTVNRTQLGLQYGTLTATVVTGLLILCWIMRKTSIFNHDDSLAPLPTPPTIGACLTIHV